MMIPIENQTTGGIRGDRKRNEKITYKTPVAYDAFEWKRYLEKAQGRFRDSSVAKEYKDNFLKFMQELYDMGSNKIILDEYYDNYVKAGSTQFFEENYVLIKEKYLRRSLSRCKILILTANPIEKAVFHYNIIRMSNEKIRRFISGNTIFYIMKWEEYWVAHVHQMQTGAFTEMGCYAAIRCALNNFTPNVIISLGVAFGIDYEHQKLGDVIVSRKILSYNDNKRKEFNKDNENWLREDYISPDRSQDKKIDNWLHARIVNATGFLGEVTYGDILSGGSVLSSMQEKDKICLGYTTNDYIVGGEMEGNALFQLSESEEIPGVVIKGICDWGIAKNDIFPNEPQKEEKFKDSLQAYAMTMAVEKAAILLSDKQLFSAHKKSEAMQGVMKMCKCNSAWLIFSVLLMFLNGIYSVVLYGHEEVFPTAIVMLWKAFDNPLVWLVYPCCIFLWLFIQSKLWKNRDASKRYIRKEVKSERFREN